MTQINGNAPLRDLSAEPIRTQLEGLKTSLTASQRLQDARPAQFVGYVAQSGIEKAFDKDGFKTSLHVSKAEFGAYRVPVVAVPDMRKVFASLHITVTGALMAGRTGRKLRSHEIERLEEAFALLEDIQEEMKKC